MEFITTHTGENHITAADVAKLTKKGNRIATGFYGSIEDNTCTFKDNNTLLITCSGTVDGREFYSESELVSGVASGAVGVTRNDYVGVYVSSSGTGADRIYTASWKVLMGGSDGSLPSNPYGTVIDETTTKAFFPFFKITIKGTTPVTNGTLIAKMVRGKALLWENSDYTAQVGEPTISIGDYRSKNDFDRIVIEIGFSKSGKGTSSSSHGTYVNAYDMPLDDFGHIRATFVDSLASTTNAFRITSREFSWISDYQIKVSAANDTLMPIDKSKAYTKQATWDYVIPWRVWGYKY